MANQTQKHGHRRCEVCDLVFDEHECPVADVVVTITDLDGNVLDRTQICWDHAAHVIVSQPGALDVG